MYNYIHITTNCIHALLFLNRRQFPWNVILLVLFVSIVWQQNSNIIFVVVNIRHTTGNIFAFVFRLWAWPSWWDLCQGKFTFRHVLRSPATVSPATPPPDRPMTMKWANRRRDGLPLSHPASTTPSPWSCAWESLRWCVCRSPSSASRAK